MNSDPPNCAKLLTYSNMYFMHRSDNYMTFSHLSYNAITVLNITNKQTVLSVTVVH